MEQRKEGIKEKESGFFSVIYDLFRSLKLTITLLILLALLSIIGTLILQNASRMEYIQRYGIGLYEVLNFFNLFDMYHSAWFSAILLLLVINLITCSAHRLPGVFHQISRGSGELEDGMLKGLPYIDKIRIPNRTIREGDIQSPLKKWFKSWRRIETEKTITLFSEKGKYSRLGVPITHLSILIILIGGILGSLYGFRGHVEILKGETVNQVYLRTKDGDIPKPIDFSVRCDDFKINYYNLPGKEKYVKDYTSLLSIHENGKEALKSAVKVNHPFHYRGLAFYQSSYGTLNDVTIGIQWKGKKESSSIKAAEGTTFSIPNSGDFIRVLKYAPQVHNFGEGVQVILFKPNQEPQSLWLLKNFPKLDEQRGDRFLLTFEGVNSREYTGLQVTKDPGVWVVWIGCGMMIFGLILSFFFSHQRFWVRIPKAAEGEIVLAGSANKNRMGFEKTFGEIAHSIRSLNRD
ncbi:MAG TPA: cytochrome c biogenesis protein ResB [Thermodesulfobacteriota bacterium]|nr:cytochrome c biogenesis protein ResB [Thermodesulfobacteriota bacterium]